MCSSTSVNEYGIVSITVIQLNGNQKICVKKSYQRGNHNPYIEEQTTQWPKEKEQKNKQRSTKHTHKTKDRITQTSVKPVDNMSSGCKSDL